MTPQDINKNKNKVKCFWCQSIVGNCIPLKFIIICDENGEVILLRRPGDDKPSPLVYCSSDCYVYEAHLRYCDRVAKGTFRKNFAVEFGGDTFRYVQPRTSDLPERWQESADQLVNESSKPSKPSKPN